MKKTLTIGLAVLFGNLSFSQTQAFTSSGSFVVPNGITSLTIEVVGAGGSGGGNGGGGGGGGGYAKGIYNVTPGTTYAVTVGTAGGGPSGGATSVNPFISASGGANGTSVANPNLGGGGVGGSGTGGTAFNYTGGTGGGGYWTYFGGGGGGAAGPSGNGSNGGNTIVWSGVCQTPGGTGGAGGGAPGGAGGKGAGFTDPNCNVTDASGNGSNYGGGGGGANGNGGGAGTGVAGYCLITWSGCTAPAAPVDATTPASLSVCGSGTTALTATGTGTINWYTSQTGITPVATGTTFITPVLTTTTTYYAEVVTCTNSTVRTAITISVNPLPSVNINPSDTAICLGSSVTLNAGGSASFYTWSLFNPAEMTYSVGQTTTVKPNVTTNYTVSGVDQNGCSNVAFSTVTISPLPAITASTTANMICKGQTVSLTAGGGTTYSWNAVAGTSVMVVSPTVTTTYTVMGVDQNGCRNTALITQSVSLCTGVAEAAAGEKQFTIYPNPSQGEFSISSTQNLELSIVDELGRQVKTISLNAENKRQVQVTHLANGVYFVIAKGQEQPVSQKIIVSR